MRILIASRLFAPEPAVAAVRLAALARELVARGHDVVVLTSRLPPRVRGEEEPGVTVRRVPVLRDRLGAVRGYLPYLSFDVPLFFRLLTTRRVDVMIVEPPPTTGVAVRLATAVRRIPYVYFAADILSDAAARAGTNSLVVAVVRGMERFALRGAARVLAVSAEFRERVVGFGVGRDGVVEVGNGADTRIFRPDGDAVAAEVPFALYAGTASTVHGAGIFVDAIAKVDGLRLVFLGSGTEATAIQEHAQRVAPGRVDVIPTVSPAEAASWLRAATVALASAAPAKGDRAAYPFFPAKLHAAAACGTPILFAGDEGTAAAFTRAVALGDAVGYNADEIVRVLQRHVDRPATRTQRRAFATWAEQHVSLAEVARCAAAVVEDAATTRRRG